MIKMYIKLLSCFAVAGVSLAQLTTIANASDLSQIQLGESSSEPTVSIKATVGSDGEILTDQRGMSIYVYSADAADKSNCTGECAKVWLPVLRPATGITTLGAVSSSLLGSLKRADGGTQVLFNGKPLYFFIEDKSPGDMKGKGKSDPGGNGP